MKKTILVGGKAGQGIARTSNLIGKVLASAGYFVFNYRDYPSLIRGGHNFNILTISEDPVYSFEEQYDLILALDQNTLEKHKSGLRKEGIIVGSKEIEGKDLINLDLKSRLKELNFPQIFGNNILIGYLFSSWGIPFNFVSEIMKEEFGEKAKKVNQAVKQGYEVESSFKWELEVKSSSKYFFSGSKAVALGSIASGLDTYLAYPMTPATPVLHYLASRQKEDDILVFQPENEIATINAALGASFGGAKTMIGTSGGGFALMAEGCSLQGMSEVPLVLYLAQRTAPSTGVPTYSSQGDLQFAINVGHGEFPRVVVAPGDPKEAFLRTQEAFYLSRKYGVLVIILSDKHLAESDFSFEKIEKSSLKSKDFILSNPSEPFRTYEITDSGISPRAVPGQGPIVRATGYEHDPEGITTERPEEIVKMADKRKAKQKSLVQKIKQMEPIKTYGSGKNLIVGWGSTKGAIIDAQKELDDFKFLQILYIEPFPQKKVKKEMEEADQVVLIENNVSGQLGEVIKKETGISVDKKILKYDGRPFCPSQIIKQLK